jgi:hypothetical protein
MYPCLHACLLTLFLTYIVPSMPWPSHIVAAFDSIPAGGLAGAKDEVVLYGALNTLLGHLFPPTDLYVISPQWKKPPEGFAIDFTAVFVVEMAQHPVFFLEVKPAGCFSSRSGRATADDQMRMRFDELIDDLSIPILHGVSVLGPHLAFYVYLKSDNRLDLLHIPRDPVYVNDRAPAKQWNVEVTSEEGIRRLTAVADHVKFMVNKHLRQAKLESA